MGPEMFIVEEKHIYTKTEVKDYHITTTLTPVKSNIQKIESTGIKVSFVFQKYHPNAYAQLYSLSLHDCMLSVEHVKYSIFLLKAWGCSGIQTDVSLT